MRIPGLLISLSMFSVACSQPEPIKERSLSVEQLDVLRGQVRESAKAACGSCHQHTSPEAKPAALAIFDLDQEQWHTPMTDHQFHEFLKRGGGKIDQIAARSFFEGELERRHRT